MILSEAQISLLAAGATNKWVDNFVPKAPTRGLVGEWNLNDNIPTATIVDSTANPANGTIGGGENSDDMSVPGKVGTALTFDGNDDITVPSVPKLNDHITTTIGAWVNTSQATGSNMQIAGRFVFRILRNNQGNGGVLIATQGPTPNFLLGTTPISDGLWHHVVGVFDGSQHLIYVDGVLDGVQATTGALSLVDQTFDMASNGAAEFFNGPINIVRNYNRALSAQEIIAWYSNEAPLLVARFDDTAATTVVLDSSKRSDKLNGVIVGGKTASQMTVPGVVDKAFIFDGINDYINFGNDSRYDIVSCIFISCWIITPGMTNSFATFVVKGGTYGIRRNGVTSNAQFILVGVGTVNGSIAIDDDQPHHIAGTYDGNTMSLYIDGVLDSSLVVSASITTSIFDLTIGGVSSGEMFNGTIDDVRLEESCPIIDQVQEMYNKTRACATGYSAIAKTAELCSENAVISDIELWSPSQINTIAWYDPSERTSITELSGAVSLIADLGTIGGEDMIQAVVANQPTTDTRTINGLNVLDCDGGDFMERATFPVPASGDISIFMVAELDVINSTNDSVYCLDATNDFQFGSTNATQFDGGIQTAGIGVNVLLTGGPFPGPSIYNTNFDFAGLVAYNAFMDGTQRAVDTAYTTKLDVSQTFRLFSNRGLDQQIDGAFGETVVTENVTIVTRELIEGYLANKWVNNLPIGHPFKLVAPLANVTYVTTVDGIVVVDGLPVIEI